MVESQPSKLAVRVQFPSPAPVDPRKVSVVRRAQVDMPSPIRACFWPRPRGSVRRLKPRSVSAAIWDMLAAGAAGLLSGRYGQEEMERPGAARRSAQASRRSRRPALSATRHAYM